MRRLRASGRIEEAFAWRLRIRRSTDRLAALVRRPGRRLLLARVPEGSPQIAVWHRGRWRLATPDGGLVVARAMQANLELVADVLEAAGVPYFVMPLPSDNRHRTCVAERDRRRVVAAFTALRDPGISVHLDDGLVGRKDVRPARAGRWDRRGLGRAHVWRVYRNYSDPAGRTVLGDLHGCEIEFWQEEPAPDGKPVLVSVRWNKKATRVDPGAPGGAQIEVGGRAYPTVRTPARARYFDDVDFAVDLVYTWVDGGDPAWRERKNRVLRDLDLLNHNEQAHSDSRFASRDELRYSLRSVAAFADFVRHIWIVTDDQIPSWLDVEHPRVTVVSHKAVFGEAGRLPTFNSHAIESRLHHIEGLAEHYVYMNDDFFFGRRVTPDRFFLSNGLSRFYLSRALMGLGPATKDVEPVDAAAKNGRVLIQRQFGCLVSQKFKHAPYPQRRSVLFEMEEAFPEEFARTAAAQLRSPTDLAVASSLYHYYAYLTGRAVPGEISSRYVDLALPGLEARLDDLHRQRNFDVWCLNDTAASPEQLEREQALLDAFFDRYLPVPSEFER